VIPYKPPGTFPAITGNPMRTVLLINAAVISILLCAGGKALSAPVLLTGTDPVTPVLEIIEDRAGALSPADAMKSKAFTGAHTANFGFTQSVIWARVSYEIPAGNTARWFLEIQYPLLDHITVYNREKSGEVAFKEYGDTLPFNARDINHHNFLIGLENEPGIHTCHLRVQSNSSMSLDMQIVSESMVISKLNVEKTLFGTFYGALFIMLVYNLLLALSMRDLTYFWYSGFIFSVLLVSLSLNGYGFQYIWKNSPWMNEAVPFTLFFSVICMGLFTRSFIETGKNHPVLDKIILGYIILAIFCTAASCFVPYRFGIQAGAAYFIPGIIIILVSCVRLLLDRNRMARYYIIAFSALFTGIVITVLHRFGQIPGTAVTLWGFQFGGAISVALFSLGLADRVNMLTRNLRELNVTLEDRVERRTRDLSRAKDELQAAMVELEAMNENLVNVNRDLERADETHRRDMSLAANVQASFLPRQIAPPVNYDIAYHFRPSSGVSGDFFDFYLSGDTLDGVGIFDVSGHGISAALLTLFAKSIIFRNFKRYLDRDLTFVIETINQELIDEIKPVDNYITGIILRFRDGSVEYVNCGHPEMIHMGASGKAEKVRVQESWPLKGTLLGIEVLKDAIPSHTMQVSPGDVLLLYTDCLYEGHPESLEQYGISRIMTTLERAPKGTAEEILEYIMSDFNAFVGKQGALHDDLTVILLKKR